MRYRVPGFREQGTGNREQGTGNREQGKNPVFLIRMEIAIIIRNSSGQS
ncbi:MULTISPECIES: hypothetical protein [unclassified Moorena]|nr:MULTISPECIES: hypothetical protein [unclassified Moorena]